MEHEIFCIDGVDRTRVRVYENVDGEPKLLRYSKNKKRPDYEPLPRDLTVMWTKILDIFRTRRFKDVLRGRVDLDPLLSTQLNDLIAKLQAKPPHFEVADLGDQLGLHISHWRLPDPGNRDVVRIQATFVQQWRFLRLGDPRSERSKFCDVALFISLVQQFCHMAHWHIEDRPSNSGAWPLMTTLQEFVQNHLLRGHVGNGPGMKVLSLQVFYGHSVVPDMYNAEVYLQMMAKVQRRESDGRLLPESRIVGPQSLRDHYFDRG